MGQTRTKSPTRIGALSVCHLARTGPRPSDANGHAGARRAMRIAYLTTQYPKISHTFIRRELRELETLGHEVLRLAIRRAESAVVDPADIEEGRRTVHCLSQRWHRLLVGGLRTAILRPRSFLHAAKMALHMGRRSERGVLRHLAYVAEAAFLCDVLRRHRIEHLHVHFGTNATAVARLIRAMGGPTYSFTLHGPDEFDAPRSFQLAEKQADAAFTVAITDYCSAQLRRWADPVHWPRIHVVHCGVGDAFAGQAEPVDPDSLTFVCVGRLCPQKGQLLLVEAMGRLHEKGLRPRLVLAGDGEMRAEVEGRIGELGLSDWVEVTGWVNERQVREHLRAARAFVLPSFAEGLPVVIMEAMALGRPVISTYVAGIPELVRPGETGWLVPAGNVELLAEAMAEAYEAHADCLTQMGRRGAALVEVRHNTRTETQRLEALFLQTVTAS